MVTTRQTAASVLPSISNITDQMRDMREEYAAGFETKWLQRPNDMPSQGAGADYHYRNEGRYYYMLEMSRHAERDDPAVGQGVGRFVANVVQGGYTYQPETGVDAVDRILLERWAEWTDDDNSRGLDFLGRNNWRKYEELTARRVILDGDMGIAPLADGRLQPFEAHRIRSPIHFSNNQARRRRFVMHGIEQNRNEQVVRYWVTKQENDGFNSHFAQANPRNLKTVPAWEVDELTNRIEKSFFHLFNPKRFSQSRGVPALHAVLNTAGMHADLQFANLVRSQIASYIGFIHEIPLSADDYEPPEAELQYDHQTGEFKRKGVDLSPGSSYYPDYPGEKIAPFSANLPNPEFFPHAKLLLTFIATSLDMPLILFLLDASETNFSSWRGAVDQFKIAAKRFQSFHAAAFHKPVLRFKQRQWLRDDRFLRRSHDVLLEDFFHHTWRYPRWQHVQPVEDVKAEVMELGNLLDSPRAVAARHNRDIEKIIRETCDDRANAILCGLEKAQELNKHPYIQSNPHETVTWREVMPLPLSDNAQMQLLTGDPSPPESESGQGPGLAAKGTQQ